ncbi:hypothetical protein C8F04DRAFT_62919 [Mycena alexandri]|uniref:Uncharacterized protein n=1 Tax=Mycena alexandri TaxID=1745969 RepID=A0AAD6SMV3_9AGAR|nr:hypothetical protein C8F04DRAFT_62919 [Mycena alexandri]
MKDYYYTWHQDTKHKADSIPFLFFGDADVIMPRVFLSEDCLSGGSTWIDLSASTDGQHRPLRHPAVLPRHRGFPELRRTQNDAEPQLHDSGARLPAFAYRSTIIHMHTHHPSIKARSRNDAANLRPKQDLREYTRTETSWLEKKTRRRAMPVRRAPTLQHPLATQLNYSKERPKTWEYTRTANTLLEKKTRRRTMPVRRAPPTLQQPPATQLVYINSPPLRTHCCAAPPHFSRMERI